MKKLAKWSIIFLCGLASGCSTIVTHKADLAEKPRGVRVYPPKVYLLIDAAERKTTLAFLPDYRRAYDVKPLSILAKQDFKIEMEDGQLQSLTSNQDPTAFLSLMKETATTAAKAAGLGVSSTVINGTFGLETGIYCLEDDGIFRRVRGQ